MVVQPRLSDIEIKAAKNLLAALGMFQEIRHTMPLQYVTAFLQVAHEEGLSVSDYSQRAGVSLSVMSRHLLDIGERNRNREDGFGLVEYRASSRELRKHEYRLSDKGRSLLKKLTSTLSK